MGIEKINVNEGHFTPDSEKDALESAHISEDEIMIVKNKKKTIEHERMKEIGENFEDSDLLPNKEGLHVDYMSEEHYSCQPFEKGKNPNEAQIRKERKNAVYRKSA